MMQNFQLFRSRGWRALFCAALFLVLGATARAQSSGSGGDPTNDGASPGDDVTSLPIFNDPTGLTLVGLPGEIRALVLEVRGTGRVYVEPVSRTAVAVTFMGALQVDLDRRALALSSVGVLFRGGGLFHGGVAQLSVLGSAPAILPADRVPMPLGRIARTAFEGRGVRLEVMGARMGSLVGVASFGPDRVTWAQHRR